MVIILRSVGLLKILNLKKDRYIKRCVVTNKDIMILCVQLKLLL